MNEARTKPQFPASFFFHYKTLQQKEESGKKENKKDSLFRIVMSFVQVKIQAENWLSIESQFTKGGSKEKRNAFGLIFRYVNWISPQIGISITDFKFGIGTAWSSIKGGGELQLRF